MIALVRQWISSLAALSSERYFQAVFGIAWLFIGAGVLLLYLRLYPEMRLQAFVPLHYNIHFGVDLIGPWWQLFTAPAIAVIITAVNGLACVHFWKKEKVLSYFFGAVATLCAIFLFVATIFIVLQNITYYG